MICTDQNQNETGKIRIFTFQLIQFCPSGTYRECFTENIILGHPDDPVIPQPDCRLAKTQKDQRSSIRACLCTEDYCNIEEEGKA